ncbi:MAG: hypothetical protein HYX29_07150 [Solirubrobacterales bacterium]|nr:hypothetical protein [Solirubrobacterales bacterium]
MEVTSHSLGTVARVVACAAMSTLLLAAFAQTAQSKGETRAILDRPVPADSKPGSTIEVAWKLESKIRDRYEPFGAGEVFFRLVGNAAGDASEVVVDGRRSFSARVRVPFSGIKKVEIGIIGVRTVSGKEGTRSDALIPIVGPSLERSADGSGGPEQNRTALVVGAVSGAALLLFGATYYRRRSSPTPTTR